VELGGRLAEHYAFEIGLRLEAGERWMGQRVNGEVDWKSNPGNDLDDEASKIDRLLRIQKIEKRQRDCQQRNTTPIVLYQQHVRQPGVPFHLTKPLDAPQHYTHPLHNTPCPPLHKASPSQDPSPQAIALNPDHQTTPIAPKTNTSRAYLEAVNG